MPPFALRPLATARSHAARDTLVACRLCAHRCGVDRTRGPAGACAAGPEGRVFHEGIEWAGETALVPTYVVSFAGCNMTCRFCLTGEPSQDAAQGDPFSRAATAARIERARGRIRSVTILGGEPSIHLPTALELVAAVAPELPVVWKTNGYGSPEGRALLEGVPAVVLADLKFGSDECASALGGVPDYTRIVRENLLHAATAPALDPDLPPLIVRHLLMPGHVDCCLAPTLEWLARELPGAPLSLMTGFLPLFFAARAGLGRTNRASEVARALALVRASGVRVAPWTLASHPDPAVEPPRLTPDEIWIDRAGNVHVDSASAELVKVFAQLADGFRFPAATT